MVGTMRSTVENRVHLLMRFFRRLRALEPASVLDVGCGDGRLLELCRDAGTRAQGIDADELAVRALLNRGLVVHEGDAAALPADASFDWVTLRHVLHHLPDAATALDEACRVAQTGVLLAEPWFDVTIPSQSLALRLDRWLKRQHQRLGRVHGDALAASEILALLPMDQNFEVELEHYLLLGERPLADLEAEAAPLLNQLAEGDPESAKYGLLLAEARQNGLTHGGTMILCLRRPQASS